ncbi:hypothetical protein N2152v2_010404 [Parachlorella kessleri]
MSAALPATLGVVGGLAGLALIAWPVGIWWFRGTTHAAEIRRYAPYLVAEVVVQGTDMRGALSDGFRQIAGFIFGKNTAAGSEGSEKVAMTAPVTLQVKDSSAGSEKIAMTAPVAAEMKGDGSYKVSFIMPSKYTKDTLPRPNNPNVHIKEVPGHTMAAITFGGNSPRENTVEQYKRRLLDLLEEAGLEPKGDEVFLYQYHPPFAPGWMRENEVLLPVKESDQWTTS